MTKDELTDWFNAHLWPHYRDLTRAPFPTKWGAGVKGEALKRLLTMKPSEELRNRIMDAISEQIMHRNKLYEQCGSMQKYLEVTKGLKIYLTRHCATWLNQLGFEDEIPTINETLTEHDIVIDRRKCKHCDQPVYGPRFEVCQQHVTVDEGGKLRGAMADEMRAQYKAHPEWKDWGPKQHAAAIREMAGRIGRRSSK